MPRRSGQSRRVPDARRKRVGAYIRERRLELGLSQGDLCKVLGYRSRNSISNIEIGAEGLPPKRAYAWADALEVPRDDFFAFVVGERDQMEPGGGPRLCDNSGQDLEPTEQELVLRFRRLDAKYQQRLLEQVEEYLVLQRHALGTPRDK